MTVFYSFLAGCLTVLAIFMKIDHDKLWPVSLPLIAILMLNAVRAYREQIKTVEDRRLPSSRNVPKALSLTTMLERDMAFRKGYLTYEQAYLFEPLPAECEDAACGKCMACYRIHGEDDDQETDEEARKKARENREDQGQAEA